MVFSEYTKRQILHHHAQGHSAPKLLQDEGIVVSRRGVYAFLLHVQRTGEKSRRPGSGRSSKMTDRVKVLVETTMRGDDETTAKELQKTLGDAGHALSLRSAFRCRTSLGWTVRGSAYCQMIRHVNMDKRQPSIYTRRRPGS